MIWSVNKHVTQFVSLKVVCCDIFLRPDGSLVIHNMNRKSTENKRNCPFWHSVVKNFTEPWKSFLREVNLDWWARVALFLRSCSRVLDRPIPKKHFEKAWELIAPLARSFPYLVASDNWQLFSFRVSRGNSRQDFHIMQFPTQFNSCDIIEYRQHLQGRLVICFSGFPLKIESHARGFIRWRTKWRKLLVMLWHVTNGRETEIRPHWSKLLFHLNQNYNILYNHSKILSVVFLINNLLDSLNRWDKVDDIVSHFFNLSVKIWFLVI